MHITEGKNNIWKILGEAAALQVNTVDIFINKV